MSAAAAKYLAKYRKTAEEEANTRPDAELKKDLEKGGGMADDDDDEDGGGGGGEEQFLTARQRRELAEQKVRQRRGLKVRRPPPRRRPRLPPGRGTPDGRVPCSDSPSRRW